MPVLRLSSNKKMPSDGSRHVAVTRVLIIRARECAIIDFLEFPSAFAALLGGDTARPCLSTPHARVDTNIQTVHPVNKGAPFEGALMVWCLFSAIVRLPPPGVSPRSPSSSPPIDSQASGTPHVPVGTSFPPSNTATQQCSWSACNRTR